MKLVIIFIRNINIYCIFKDFEEMLDYLTIVSLRSHFFKTNLISLTLLQSVDFVYRLKRKHCASVFCVQNIAVKYKLWRLRPRNASLV